jgi:hypothetical protein
MDPRLNLDDIDFDQLAELGRSLIPSLAPAWTDHNAHDPGIMLIELMAWVAEAQIYSLARLRRDERLAYAGLVGVRPQPPTPATALIWPTFDPASLPAFLETTVGAADVVVSDRPDAPRFRLSATLRITAARPTAVKTETADGRVVDQTRANDGNAASYQPFGPAPGPDDRLALHFQASGADLAAAPLSLGVEAAASITAPPGTPSHLRAAVRDSAGERAVTLEDRTAGLLQTGVILVHLADAAPIEPEFTLVLSAPSGLVRPPRVHRILPNVLPVEQIEHIELEEAPGFGEGLPDQTYRLIRSELTQPDALSVTLLTDAGAQDWTIVPDFRAAGPADHVVTFDPAEGVLLFGNGLNGAVPPPGASLQLKYDVCAGARGNLSANALWRLKNVDQVFGGNRAAATGGVDGSVLADLQAQADAEANAHRASVTAEDLADHALGQRDLAVARAVEAPPDCHRTPGARILVAVGATDDAVVENPAWLSELRRRLAPSLLLGQSLQVKPPRYVDVGIKARLTAAPGADPAAIVDDAGHLLTRRLRKDGPDGGWPFGRDLTPAMVGGWLRAGVAGVARVESVQLLRGGVAQAREVRLGPFDLPRLVLADGDITAERAGARATA